MKKIVLCALYAGVSIYFSLFGQAMPSLSASLQQHLHHCEENGISWHASCSCRINVCVPDTKRYMTAFLYDDGAKKSEEMVHNLCFSLADTSNENMVWLINSALDAYCHKNYSCLCDVVRALGGVAAIPKHLKNRNIALLDKDHYLNVSHMVNNFLSSLPRSRDVRTRVIRRELVKSFAGGLAQVFCENPHEQASIKRFKAKQ